VCVTRLFAGSHHSAAICDNGTVWVWGWNRCFISLSLISLIFLSSLSLSHLSLSNVKPDTANWVGRLLKCLECRCWYRTSLQRTELFVENRIPSSLLSITRCGRGDPIDSVNWEGQLASFCLVVVVDVFHLTLFLHKGTYQPSQLAPQPWQGNNNNHIPPILLI